MTEILELPRLVTVFGGSGFLGRYVVRALAKRGYRIRVAVRRPDLAGFLQPLGNLGQIMAVQANGRVPWSVERALSGAGHAINLTGVLYESGRQRFDAVHETGARAIAEAARAEGVPMVHVSALGADMDSDSAYALSKARGEAAVFETLPDAVIFRSSIVFGPEDQFFNRFANMARFSPVLPLIGGGHTRFQPVYVGDVAEAIARAVDGRVSAGRVYELGGPEIKTFRECIEEMLRVIERKRLLLPLPWFAGRLAGAVLGRLPGSLLTSDQVTLLQQDNVVSEAANREQRSLEGLGIVPTATEAILASYLWRFRPAGQFTQPNAA